MRVTFSIDDDLLAAARNLAREKSQPIERVLSDLVRLGLNATPRVSMQGETDFPVFRLPDNAHPITLDDVKRLWDED